MIPSRAGIPSQPGLQHTFCILGLPRSGTTWLLDLRHHPPQAHCPNEILIRNPLRHGIPGHRHLSPSVSHLGFKILDWQNAWWFRSLMQHKDIPVILQWRSNSVRQLYSSMAAAKSGIYHHKPLRQQLRDRLRHGVRALARLQFGYAAFAARTSASIFAAHLAGSPPYQPQPLTISPEELDRFIATRLARVNTLRSALIARRGPWLEITYEQLSGPTHHSSMLKIQEFLGLTPLSLDSSMRPLNDRPLRDLLANHDELEAHCHRHDIPFA